MSIIIGIIIIIGLFRARWSMKTIIPSDATIMTAGRTFWTMLPGIVRGISGGGSRCTSPPGGLGAARRGVRLNCSVLTGRNNLSVSERALDVAPSILHS
ncbi:hypothetical protein HNR68_001186 [Saccharopolyspora hordei]|uniref:Uncharacterized protein n=1 Tax=Saccharopolyspora hordei TaxID=1838 RepID=A0A853AFF7_9PSEU|nr:hypothetical protein [Saccharopolyspora hordei]